MLTNEFIEANLPPQKDLPQKLMTGVDRAAAGAHGVINSASNTVQPAVKQMTIGAHRAIDRVAAVAFHAAETLGANGEQLLITQKKLTATATDYVGARPLLTLGLALAAGYVIALVLSRR